ncbi:MAG: RNA degradosome polyphosphate kinase, partial [Trichodesmium sp. MAG_R04]|nr:RNA degradosome polyphosphate kinase [Trichodesmium sp. MAG_R04]
MSKNKKNTVETPVEKNLSNPQYYFNREFSWLEFNRRVLSEGLDPRTPLLERLKFLGIFSSNLDEYFMVRVAVLKKQIEAEVYKLTPDGHSPQEQLDGINQILLPMFFLQHQFFEKKLRPELGKNGIYILNYIDLNQEQKTYLKNYFEEHVFP